MQVNRLKKRSSRPLRFCFSQNITRLLRFNVPNLSINLFAFKQDGGTAVEAVEQAVRVFEEHAHFNAGRGSCLNTSGEVECDAMIMDGHEMKTGRYTVRRKTPKC